MRIILVVCLAFSLSLPIFAAGLPSGRVTGLVLTPQNQEAEGVYLYIAREGCESPDQLFVEIQYPDSFNAEKARAAILTMHSGDDQSLELLLHQKEMGKGLLITNLCLTPKWLGTARVELIYGGVGSADNIVIETFALWPIEKSLL